MDKALLVEAFRDTQLFIEKTPVLKKMSSASKKNTRLIETDRVVSLKNAKADKAGNISVDRITTVDAALLLSKKYPGRKIGILNFASSISPGGGVKHGALAQEEDLCRCTTLYNALDQRWLKKAYYAKNKEEKNPLHSDACIYTPKVIICKSGGPVPGRLSKRRFVEVDVISCSAPKALKVTVSERELFNVYEGRVRRILKVAASCGIEVLITGAFGCGAYGTDPQMAAKAWKYALREYRDYFRLIEFAIWGENKRNYTAFSKVFQE